jgi:hypothetical protein
MLPLQVILAVVLAASSTSAFSARIQNVAWRSQSTAPETMRTTSFQSSTGKRRNRSATVLLLVDGDMPPEESTEYTGSVDWDAEWKKVVANEGKIKGGVERPGKDFYKSEAEIAAIKAANSATEKIVDVTASVSNALPDIRSLSGDWKFWIAILALVSVGLSVLTAPGNVVPTGLQGDSYYI